MMEISTNGALFCGQFGMSILQVVFMFYYVNVFLNIYKVNEYWFSLAQVLFLIWNTVNDPVFGYMQDSSHSWFHVRQKVFRYLGPFTVLSFLLLWYRWADPDSPQYVVGLHLIIGLFLYDAFYSCINVAWSALFAESTSSKTERVTAIQYSQMAVMLSVNMIMIIEKLSNSLGDFFVFQAITVIVAIIAQLCFLAVSSLKERYAAMAKKVVLLDEHCNHRPILQTAKQIITSRDFLVIVTSNFIHTCRSTSHLNFTAIATEILIPENVLPRGSWKISLFYGVCTLVPQILVIISGTRIVKYGAYSVVRVSFLISVLAGLFTMLFSNANPCAIILFMFIDSVLVHSVAPLFQILIADFIDKDAKNYQRSKPLSSTIFSLSSMLIKPAQSVAPVIIVHILNNYGFSDYQLNKIKSVELVQTMFVLLCGIPLLLGAAQFVLFQFHSMKIQVEPII